jgi:hypothetical protein
MRMSCMAVFVSYLVLTSTARAQPFSPGCTLPFASIAQHHDIDDNCANEGGVTLGGSTASGTSVRRSGERHLSEERRNHPCGRYDGFDGQGKGPK